MLLRWLSAKLRNKDDAQDVLQSVYARAIAFSDANEIENAKALIFRVASRLAVDEIRRRARSRANDAAAGASEEQNAIAFVPSDAPSSEQTIIAREEYQSTMRALGALPSKARAAFLLNRVYGYTYAEIATELGVSVSSVEKYMISALKQLRRVNPGRMAARERGAKFDADPGVCDFLTFAAGKAAARLRDRRGYDLPGRRA